MIAEVTCAKELMPVLMIAHILWFSKQATTARATTTTCAGHGN